MPTIETVEGIKMNIYFNHHLPPHIQALYNEFEVLIEIETKSIYAGSIPARQLRKVKAWLRENEQEALGIFYEFNENLRP